MCSTQKCSGHDCSTEFFVNCSDRTLTNQLFWQNRCHPMLTNVLQTFLQVNECSTLAELESLEVDVCYTLVCAEICLQNKCMLLLVSVLSVNCPKLMCRTIANKCCMCSTLLLLHNAHIQCSPYKTVVSCDPYRENSKRDHNM